MIVYLDKNKTPNVVCDGDNILTGVLAGDNIIIERDFASKTIKINSDAKNDIFNNIKAGENVTIEHDKNNKTIVISSDAKNETMNSIKAGDNIVIMDDGGGGATINALIDILDKNPLNPKPGYMWILNNGGKNPGNTGGNTGSGTEGETDGNIVVADGTFACFDENGNFYSSEDNGASWQKHGQIECDSGVCPVAGIVLGGNTIVTAAGAQLYYSDNGGSTWNMCTQSVYSYIRDIQYINGQFYACCGAATDRIPAPAILMVSDNGIMWKTALQKYNSSLFVFHKIQYINNTYFLFACQLTGGGSKILCSANGRTWTETTGDNGSYPLFPKLLYNGTFYIVARNDTLETYTSEDGMLWTATGEKIIDGVSFNLRNLVGLEEIDNKFYAVFSHAGQDGLLGKAVSSSTGIKWGDASAGDVTIAILRDISNGFCRHDGKTYHLDTSGTLLSSELFSPWINVGTVPLENAGTMPICNFSILQK